MQATQTHYTFACGNVDLKLTFSAPLFMDDLKLMTRPVNYISYEIVSNDKKAHNVDLYFEASSAWALDKPLQQSVSEGFKNGNLVFLKTGSVEQQTLAKQGDDLRIDWGYFYMVAENKNTSYGIGNSEDLRSNFVKGAKKDFTAKKNQPDNKLALIRNLGTVSKSSGKIMLGYDDIYSIQYFGDNLRPY